MCSFMTCGATMPASPLIRSRPTFIACAKRSSATPPMPRSSSPRPAATSSSPEAGSSYHFAASSPSRNLVPLSDLLQACLKGRIGDIDLGRVANRLHQREVLFAHKDRAHLVLDLLERRRLLEALVLDRDYMPAELRLYRLLRMFAGVQRKRHLLEFRHHLPRPEPAEVAAGGLAARIVGFFVGELLKIRAAVELLDDVQRFLLGLYQD